MTQYPGAVPETAPWGVPPVAPPPRRSSRRGRLWAVLILVILLAGVVAGQFLRPLPVRTLRLTTVSQHTFTGTAPVLPWPTGGQAAVAVDGLGSLGGSGGEAPTSTASVAKVMTAYVFLKDHPLQAGAAGPTFTISPQEAQRLQWRKARDESNITVTAGEPFTERQALEALLLVSANSLAHELARWDAGDDGPFAAKMNATARELGMTHTTYTDPSGFDPATVSTAADQVKLLTAAMKLPAFATVVAEPDYVSPTGSDAKHSSNTLLGKDGVIGGKTGFTSAAGGNFVVAAQDNRRLIVGAVMNQKPATDAGAAILAAQKLVAATEQALVSVTIARQGDVVAQIDDGLGGRTPVAAAAPVTVVGWPGLTVPITVEDTMPADPVNGDQPGVINTGGVRTGLVLKESPPGPSLVGRIIRLN